MELTFVLKKVAKGRGGDKYVCSTDSTFNIYFPQNVSRRGGEAQEELSIQIKTEEVELPKTPTTPKGKSPEYPPSPGAYRGPSPGRYKNWGP